MMTEFSQCRVYNVGSRCSMCDVTCAWIKIIERTIIAIIVIYISNCSYISTTIIHSNFNIKKLTIYAWVIAYAAITMSITTFLFYVTLIWIARIFLIILRTRLLCFYLLSGMYNINLSIFNITTISRIYIFIHMIILALIKIQCISISKSIKVYTRWL